MSDGKFSTPEDILQIVTTIETNSLLRAQDRAQINRQFNGDRPLTAEEETKLKATVNVNKLSGYNTKKSADLQMNSALLFKEYLFNATCKKGDKNKRAEWGQYFTTNIHVPLKRGRSGNRFKYLMLDRNSTLVLHGIGPLWWANDFNWMPRYVALEDLLVPTDSPPDWTEELSQIGVNFRMTPWMLYKSTQIDKTDQGWNKKFALEIFKNLRSMTNFTPTEDFWMNPEKMVRYCKEHATYLNSDAVPKVKCTNFYHQDPETGKWWRKVIVRENQSIGVGKNDDQFLYEGKQPFADSIDQIFHVQYGDGNAVAPCKYQTIRGIGVPLYSVVELDNRLYSQTASHIFENLVPLLRVTNPADRDRPHMLMLQAYGEVEDGVNFVPQAERHQVNERLIEQFSAQNRQLIGENSSSYVQGLDNGTQKEQTLGESEIKLQTANKLVRSMLEGAYTNEGFLYEEIVRRFLNPTSPDPEVKEFQAACKRDRIPDELMRDPKAWQIDVTRVAGGGDQTLATMETQFMMSVKPQLDPSAQRDTLRDAISVITRNPDLANARVPRERETVTPATRAADVAFSNLMLGAPIEFQEGFDHGEYVQQLIQKSAAIIQRIEQTDQLGTPQDVIGLNMVMEDINKHLEFLSQDTNNKEFVTAASKELSSMGNMVKSYQQRQQEQADKAKPDPEAAAKAAAFEQQSQAKLQAKAEADAQKMAQKEAGFEQKLQQQQQSHELKMAQQSQQAIADMRAESLKLMAELEAMRDKTQAQIQADNAKADADIENQKAKAKAAPKSTPKKD